MRLGIVGMGRMGSAVQELALQRGHEVVLTLDVSDDQGALERQLRSGGPEVLIEFTTAGAVLPNIRAAAATGIPMVVGTTGWLPQLEQAEQVIRSHDGALVYGSNFSIGANLFKKLVETAGILFDSFPDYDPFIIEHHHRHKVDAPSGTAALLAETLLRTVTRKARAQAGNASGAIANEALQVSSVRAGSAFGVHEVGFDGRHDLVTLRHEARGRTGFAEGALWAAEWILGRTGVYAFSEALFGSLGDTEEDLEHA